jgi:amino acid permease
LIWPNDPNPTNFFASKTCYVLLLAFITLPFIVKKELKELKIASVILFAGVAAFILIFAFQLIFEGAAENTDTSYHEYFTVDMDISSIKGVAIIIVAFSMQQNLFPMYNSLRVKTNKEALRATLYTVFICGCVYLAIPLLGLFFFGHVVDQNILNNIAVEQDKVPSIVLRVIFLLVLGCHVPFIFFTGKESTLIIVDEIMRNSISKALSENIEAAAY